jgi:hypothetical protein
LALRVISDRTAHGSLSGAKGTLTVKLDQDPQSEVAGVPTDHRGFFLIMQNAAFEICERVAEAQSLIHDHVECGRHSAEQLVLRLRVLFEERALLQAMYDVGYFPQNTPLPGNMQ